MINRIQYITITQVILNLRKFYWMPTYVLCIIYNMYNKHFFCSGLKDKELILLWKEYMSKMDSVEF